MTSLHRRAALAGALGVALAGGAMAQEAPRAFPLKKAFRFLDVYLKMPAQERDRFTLAYYVEQAGERPPPPGTRVWVVQGPQRTELPLSPSGRISHPTLAMLQNKAATITLDKSDPNTKLGLSMSLEATARPATQMSAPDLAAAIEQTNRAIKRAGGVIGFAVPRMGRVEFVGSGSGEAVLADGRRAPLPVIEGHPAFVPAALPTARTLVLARTPARLAIGSTPKAAKR